MSLLEARSVSVSAGNKLICTGMDFQLERDECWGILGTNGVGKTTLLHVLAGLKNPDQGDILVNGRMIGGYQRKALARQVGILFQDSHDSFPVTALDTVLTGRHPHLPFWALESADDIAMSMQALEQVSLSATAHRMVNTLSGGERRRLSLATLLVQGPEIWLLDEPTNHLDVHQQIVLLDLIVKKVINTGGGIMMVLHDVNLVTRFCTHALLMVDPDTWICGPVADVITVANLQALYRHSIGMIESGGNRYFYPT